MRENIRWIIVDTETDGIRDPIHVVEIAAQAMCGSEPCGTPFQVFLNHEIPIPPEATAVHGYTREFLAENGISPTEAHRRFAVYVNGAPLVCHNLAYDWNRALLPEWNRLDLPPPGRPGFCTLLLSRRVIGELRRHNLDGLKNYFNIRTGRSHQAAADVQTVVVLYSEILAPRLTDAGIHSFDEICKFSRRTPIKKCLSLFRK